ncbi:MULTISPECIES: hypothetical protein [unclassified Kribbella]|uniref:hypothetical protein n=1 Tax=unclassified Kribbella TaxID=2644121 RepID=UPI0033F28B0B
MASESAEPRTESAEPRTGASSPGATATALAGTVADVLTQRTRSVLRLVFSPLLDVVLPMVVAEGVRRTDLAGAIAKDVEAALANVDLTALVLERVDLDAVVKAALATVDPKVLAEQIADAQKADGPEAAGDEPRRPPDDDTL